MKINSKGFTVVELILSFAFVSILSTTLFAAVTNYKDKELKVAGLREIREFRDKMVIEIQNDIELRLLRDIDYCDTTYKEEKDNDYERIQRLCLDLNFLDNTSKKLMVITENKKKIETIGEQSFEFDDLHDYISYGDIRFEVPDTQNIYIGNDFMFRKTSLNDGIENNIAIYNITIPLKHKTLDGNFDISITASGKQSITNEPGKYKSYNVGEIVKVQVNPTKQEDFYVFKPSNSYNSKITLITKNNLATSRYYMDKISGNSYKGSIVERYLSTKYDEWLTVDEIRLPYAEEIGFLVNACPRYMIENESTAIDLQNVSEWIYTEEKKDGDSVSIVPNAYWTQTGKKEGQNEVWVVDGINREMKPQEVDNTYGIRAVVKVDKEYIIGTESGTYRIILDGRDADNNTITKPTVTCNRNVLCNLPTNPYVKDGYTFMGWGTTSDSSEVKYENGASVMNLATQGDVTLYAIWTRN